MARVHFNNFSTTLDGAIIAADTSITLATSIPSLGSDYVHLTIYGDGFYEIIKIASNAGAPTYTVTRAQEGTSARDWASGTSVECRVTRDSLDTKQDDLDALAITSATVASTDKVLIQDVSDSDNLKTVTAQSIADLASGGSSGTFTPVLEGTTAAGTGTYTTQRGTYFTMSGACFIEIYLVWTAHSGTGEFRIAGLPFEGKTSYSEQIVPVTKCINYTNGSTSYSYMIVTDSSTTAILKAQSGTSGEGAHLVDSAATLVLSGFYFID